jgi:hypothetical protein
LEFTKRKNMMIIEISRPLSFAICVSSTRIYKSKYAKDKAYRHMHAYEMHTKFVFINLKCDLEK